MIIYVHGVRLDPTETSSSADLLRRSFPGLIEFRWDNKEPNEAINRLIALVDTSDDDEEVILVGSSLGGFICENVAMYRRVSLVLLNPSLMPHISLTKYHSLNRVDVIDSYRSLHNSLILDKENTPRRIVLSSDDPVIDSSIAAESYKGFAKVCVVPSVDHHMTYGLSSIVIEKINKTINDIYEK